MNRFDESSEQSASSLQTNEENINYEKAFKEMQAKERELYKRTEMLEKMMLSLSTLLPPSHSMPDCSTPVDATAPTFSSPIRLPNPAVMQSAPASYSKSYLRDVLELVPKYDGHNIPVWQFARACKRATESVPLVDEALFVRMLRNKLSHHAYLAVEDEIHPTVERFLDCLKRTFGSGRNSNYYRGQLSMAYKKPNEHVLDYIGRVKDLKTAIIEGDIHNLGRPLSHVEIASIEAFALDAFFEGLPREYRVELRAEGYANFSDACAKVIAIDKRLEREEIRNRITRTSRDNSMSHNVTRIQQRDSAVQNDQARSPDLTGRKICNFCKSFGHLANECRKRQYRDGPYNNSNTNNYNNNNNSSNRNNDANNNRNNYDNRNNGNNLPSTNAGNSTEVSVNRASRGLANNSRSPVTCMEGIPVPSTSFAETMDQSPPSYSNHTPSQDQQHLC